MPPTLPPLAKTDTKYYLMQSDVPEDMAREAKLRLDRTFEEYAERTKDFARAPTDKLPFYLFKTGEEYYAAGAPQGTGGVFMVDQNGPRLMAIAHPGSVWHVTQHEGFHQFAYFAISKKLPIWVNEGLAEYFGESIFTGDAMLSGLVPEGRRVRIQKMIADKKYHPFGEIISISSEQWLREMNIQNYDEAWSMVHFMAEGDGGRYQRAFLTYMKALAHGVDGVRAWTDIAGNDTAPFEAAWKRYWTSLPVNPTLNKYIEARMMVYASFLARSKAAGQTWNTLPAFLEAAKADQVKLVTDNAPNDPRWLPNSLLKNNLSDIPDEGTYTLYWNGPLPRLVRQGPDGTRITVSFQLRDGKPHTIVDVAGPHK